MDQLPKWVITLATGIIAVGSILFGSGYLAKSSELSEYKTTAAQTYAQSSDVQSLETRMNKRLDDMANQMDKRFDRLEDIELKRK